MVITLDQVQNKGRDCVHRFVCLSSLRQNSWCPGENSEMLGIVVVQHSASTIVSLILQISYVHCCSIKLVGNNQVFLSTNLKKRNEVNFPNLNSDTVHLSSDVFKF